MDPAGEFLGVEERGEVVIRGANIMGGYENNTAANERAFTRGWLRTGDEGYLDADGFLFITGRLKETINRGGEKIGPVEVENVLMNHPAVIEAVVFPVPHAQLGEDVGAVLVLRANMDATERELREFTAQRLTPFKVPQQIVFVDEIPKGATGKVQRIRLAEQLGINAHPHAPKEIAAYKSPESPLERDLASIWADVLGLKQVGANSNFFDLGGDSILATQIISRVLKKFRVQLPFLLFFDSPSVAEMARYLETAGAEEPVSEVSIIQPISRRQGKKLPLSFAQQRLWFLNQLEPDSPSYNVPKFIRLRGSLDVRALEQTLNAIIARHEVLRTTFPTHDGIPFQAVTEARSLLIAFIDLGEWRDADRNAELQRLLKAEAQQPFNLSADVMLRATLVRLGEEDHVLLLTMHHIASDGWSAGVLARELAAFYTSFTKGTPVSLPELPIQYADFSVWQQQWLQGEVLEKQLSYWKQRLANLQSLELPTDRPRPAEQTFHGAWRSFELSGALTDALHALSRGGEVTLFMTLLAAFQTLLHMYSGQDDIVIGSPIANRNRVETEGLIGFFVNTLVLRTDFSGNPSFRELLRRVRQVCVGAYAHQDVPFEKLVEELRIERDLSRNPLFQATFQLGNVPTEAVSFPCIDVEYIEGENTTTKFDLSLFTIEEGHQLKGSLGYSTDLFDGATIDKMLCHFQKLLDCVVKNPDQLLATLPILTDDERDNLQKKRANAQQLRFGAVDSLASREKLFKRQASFSAAKRALLEKRLRGEPTGGSEA